MAGPAHPAYRHGLRAKGAPPRSLPTANIILNRALLSGTIARQPCAKCGSDEAEGHHEDYDQPLAVVWLCRPCHREADALLRASRGVARLSPITAIRQPREVKWPHILEAARALGPGHVSPTAVCRLLLTRGISVTRAAVRKALRVHGAQAA